MSNIAVECKEIAKAEDCAFKIESAAKITTFKGGGNACVFYPESESRFIGVYKALRKLQLCPHVLGGGSDTVIADGLCAVPLISTRRLNGVQIIDDKAYAGSGAFLYDVTRAFREHNCGGFEFLSGVPLTVGGAVRMNAGAFSSQTADYVDEIRILTRDYVDKDEFKIVTLKRCDVDFGYRQGVDDVILSAVLIADGVDRAASEQSAKRYAAARAKKQPKYPSCGSVFKNGEVPSGKLIEECGLKGIRIGGAQISELHGNFIVNRGGATATDFISLVRLAEDSVYARFGVKLQREFVYLDGVQE